MAFRFAGVDYDPVKLPEPKKETKYHPLDSEHKYPEEIETYTIKNRDGKMPPSLLENLEIVSTSGLLQTMDLW